MPCRIGPQIRETSRQVPGILKTVVEPIHLQFVQKFPLEPELDAPHRTLLIPAVAVPQVLKPELARLLDLTCLVVDAARDRPMLREGEPCPVPAIRVGFYLPIGCFVRCSLARPRHKLPEVVHPIKAPRQI